MDDMSSVPFTSSLFSRNERMLCPPTLAHTFAKERRLCDKDATLFVMT